MSRFFSPLRCLTACLALAAWAYAPLALAEGYKTTYGQDPIPDSRCELGYLKLGYGVDPIPVKSLRERLYDWHNNIPDTSRTVQTYPPVRPRPRYSAPDRGAKTPDARTTSQAMTAREAAKPSSRRTAQQPPVAHRSR